MNEENSSKLADTVIPPSATSVFQIKAAQQSLELGAVQFDALLTFSRNG